MSVEFKVKGSFWHKSDISRDIKRHNLDNHIPIVNTLETNFADFFFFWGGVSMVNVSV